MKCLILAAGYATRLYPLTENFPKPLLKVGNKTILDWLIDDIDGAGLVDEYIVISNHKFAHHFQNWAAEKQQKVTVVDDGTSSNETRLGAVCDIQFAIEQLGLDDDMLVIAGDNLLDFSLQRFARYAKEKGTSCIMRFYEPNDEKLLKCGVVTTDQTDRVLRMTEKSPTPETHWCCPPFYYYTKDDARLVKKGIESGCGTDAPGSYIAWLCTQTAVHAMEMPGRRYDIGNLQSYEQVQKDYQGITIA
ncbi:MAG: nucleotidyltransferase family protein [Bacteroidaceae bacterium]|jgi:glucose-1-phosphate thymidylyltransferase|nr:nucleotidyltransferase family protein [Bacteroidaceae bacterium]